MYVIHNSSERSREYVSEDTLEYVTKKKISKLIQQIKTQKILKPEIVCDEVIIGLENFTQGEMEATIGNLHFELKRDENSFYITKSFKDDYPFTTMRYYSLTKDDRYEEYRKIRFS
ncbi:MAG: hypothetical protein IJI66_01780 [Erysipelotrichaceae bacterium]|nr:hypothetical protein [Erysipelotrichaceae bacterium]